MLVFAFFAKSDTLQYKCSVVQPAAMKIFRYQDGCREYVLLSGLMKKVRWPLLHYRLVTLDKLLDEGKFASSFNIYKEERA